MSNYVSYTRIYQTWRDMIARCTKSNDTAYKYYGARGIKVCSEWHDLDTFISWANANGYSDDLTIDRIDTDGDYAPDNCRFISLSAQARNRRSAVLLTAFGETKSLIDWSEDARCAVPYMTLYQRIQRLAWQPEKAITTRGRYGS